MRSAIVNSSHLLVHIALTPTVDLLRVILLSSYEDITEIWATEISLMLGIVRAAPFVWGACLSCADWTPL